MKRFLILILICLAQAFSPVLVKINAQQLDLNWTKGNLESSRIAPGINGQCLTTTNGVSAWGSCASGTGTVTSFSSGNLAPLFSTSVATPTTTPSLAFTLTNAAAHSFFGNKHRRQRGAVIHSARQHSIATGAYCSSGVWFSDSSTGGGGGSAPACSLATMGAGAC